MSAQVASSATPVSNRAAYLLILAGICAALHIWKIPPALPELQRTLGLTLIQSGFLLSVVQVAGMTLGLMVGLLAEKIGLRRCILIGLSLLMFGSVVAPIFGSAFMLLAMRVIEGLGFFMVAMPAPPLIRRLVQPVYLSRVLGIWGCFIPIATVVALLGGSYIIALGGWQSFWYVSAVVTALVWWAIWSGVPSDRATRAGEAPSADVMTLIRETLGSRNIWFLAACFSMYSGQWLAVVGFLPTIYVEAGFTGTQAGAMTMLAAGANVIGNFLAGWLLHRHFRPHVLIIVGFVTMGLSAFVAFALAMPTAVQLALVFVFSAVGGLIPTTLYFLVMHMAPSRRSLAPSMGWLQQGVALGQFCGPPIVAWVATVMGSWKMTGVVPAVFALVGILVAMRLGRRFSQVQAIKKAP